jgi:hypothetical protein
MDSLSVMDTKWRRGSTINEPLRPTHTYVACLPTPLLSNYTQDLGNSQRQKEWYRKAKAWIIDVEWDVRQWTCLAYIWSISEENGEEKRCSREEERLMEEGFIYICSNSGPSRRAFSIVLSHSVAKADITM